MRGREKQKKYERQARQPEKTSDSVVLRAAEKLASLLKSLTVDARQTQKGVRNDE